MGWVSSPTTQSLYPREKKLWYSLYRRLGGHQGRSGQVRKLSPSPGIDLRKLVTHCIFIRPFLFKKYAALILCDYSINNMEPARIILVPMGQCNIICAKSVKYDPSEK